MPKSLDLDVDSPDKISDILRDAAEEYYEAEGELSAAWQGSQAGKVWTKIAKILEQAADKIDKLDF